MKIIQNIRVWLCQLEACTTSSQQHIGTFKYIDNQDSVTLNQGFIKRTAKIIIRLKSTMQMNVDVEKGSTIYDWRQIQTFNAQRLVHDSDSVVSIYSSGFVFD